MIYSKGFMALAFIFRSLIHFELIFIYVVKQGTKFTFFFMCKYSCPSFICWKDHSLLNGLGSLLKSQCSSVLGLPQESTINWVVKSVKNNTSFFSQSSGLGSPNSRSWQDYVSSKTFREESSLVSSSFPEPMFPKLLVA